MQCEEAAQDAAAAAAEAAGEVAAVSCSGTLATACTSAGQGLVKQAGTARSALHARSLGPQLHSLTRLGGAAAQAVMVAGLLEKCETFMKQSEGYRKAEVVLAQEPRPQVQPMGAVSRPPTYHTLPSALPDWPSPTALSQEMLQTRDQSTLPHARSPHKAVEALSTLL